MRKPHGAAAFLFHRPSDRVLLQHRTTDAPSYPDHWGMFGGAEEAEDHGNPFLTVCRELHEELSLELEPDRVVRLWDYVTSRGAHRYIFLYPWDDPDFPFDQREGQGRGWFTPDDALTTL